MPWYLLLWFFLLFFLVFLTWPSYRRRIQHALEELNDGGRELVLRLINEGKEIRPDQADEINEWISKGEIVVLRLLPKGLSNEYLLLFGNRETPADKKRDYCLAWLEAVLTRY